MKKRLGRKEVKPIKGVVIFLLEENVFSVRT